ncbi:MAG TPA: Hsp70 family protein [Bryobacteraceae bacterium]|nr:Hsp70 family protein [Bryobacteraceae bacterium]
MRLGIDFGTTSIVAAVVDRGNYPVVTFEGPGGYAPEQFPSLVALEDSSLLYGWEAWKAQENKRATVVRSVKRFLQEAGPDTSVDIAGRRFSMLDLIGGLAQALHTALEEESSLEVHQGEPLEVMLGVPASANANQRFLTVEAFERADFNVLGVLNEPSAASIEFVHAARNRTGLPGHILIYDLGGGTFDASLVEVEEQAHRVLASEGIASLGGDDFDDVLAEVALEMSGINSLEHDSLSPADVFWLHEECRQKKESVHPNTKVIGIDLDMVLPGWEPVFVPVAEFYRRCQPLIDRTLRSVAHLLSQYESEVDAVYVTGGGSELPLVARALHAAFGDCIRRSGYAHSATAIGLAIQADADSDRWLTDKMTRNFGVWREAEQGHRVIFDALLPKGTELPAVGQSPFQVIREYQPAHNIGHFRYLECGDLQDGCEPAGDITLWDEILFPFDPALVGSDCSAIPIRRCENACEQVIRESYSCDSNGGITVNIANISAGYDRSYRLGRWAGRTNPIVLGRRYSSLKATQGSTRAARQAGP